MSNQTIENQLDFLIHLLETLPARMCDEMSVREQIKKRNQDAYNASINQARSEMALEQITEMKKRLNEKR